ncbi:excinuclease ABC subunit UvrA [Flavobacterium oreochromis]|uniref:UvrABC system protein A n=2 Tax=Flavobacterium TaxID=237 RepID=A0A246G9H9_9FLAO|nr:excinuclease ABC subunit UvrA [Flavobacterium oreochromis]OWP76242.1 excinuclease ABC subunit A [Flavobacterium oreochromis]OWP76906.1 excinuclease ABC subunit A [Flavobacterium oreochromis]POR18450.1 excinuclease ABC subunit A [Flavobacterium columnare]
MIQDIHTLDPKKNILIKGAQIHNLKNLDVAIPRNKLVVITGLSGSGKSSLAFDTLYAEGQRRYVESLSSYARQFLGRLDKPKVDYIKGIAPAVAIEQKVNTTNARSTVGTSTEIYDYLKLLFARIGKTYSPISGLEVKKNTVTDVIQYVEKLEEGSRYLLLAPIYLEEGRTLENKLKVLLQQGFSRILINNETIRLDEFTDSEDINKKEFYTGKDILLIIDRLVIRHEEDFYNRLADAVQTAFYEGKGFCYLQEFNNSEKITFSANFELDGLSFLEPNIHLFSFNNPYGACPTCEGYGNIIGIDHDLVIPNTALSVYENCIAPWKGESMSWYRDQLVNNSHKFSFPIHKPYFELEESQKQLIWEGNQYFEGLNTFFKELEEKNYKIQNRVLLSRYRGKTKCTTCKGKRLRPEASYVKIERKTLPELVDLPIRKLIPFFKELKLSEYDAKVAKRLLIEINNRLAFLENVGLDYLTLNRNSATLSGGESQRINLATSLGSSLVGSMYILDEPSIGLHPKDTEKLTRVLESLRDLGNTVIVVEHDEDIMKSADMIIDIGPEAGTYGGNLVAQGTYEEILQSNSLTSQYLNGKQTIDTPQKRRKFKNHIDIIGARENNLQNLDVTIPLDVLTIITGVSGSGKSTLVKKILYPALQKQLEGVSEKPGEFTEISGNYSHIKHVEYVDQNPIGRSSRSNPVTYIKAYDDIRDLFAKEKVSKLRGYQPKHFSFNVEGGRCESCKGEGTINVEMVFMADVSLPCETCNGKRFKKEILEVQFEGKNIDDILKLTIDDALDFFKAKNQNKIVLKLQPLQDVGLGYVQLGQSSSTLSGGEAQRIKLASFLVKGATKDKALFIFDEPTTGLHFHDIKKLLKSFDALIEKGHSILVIEHNLDMIKCADYIIDLGPEGGENGGQLLAFGTPEQVAKNKKSITGIYLKNKL